jgi:hypothetical protein
VRANQGRMWWGIAGHIALLLGNEAHTTMNVVHSKNDIY